MRRCMPCKLFQARQQGKVGTCYKRLRGREYGMQSSDPPHARTSSAISVRHATPEDAAAIAAMYNYYVTNTVVTFEQEAVSAAEVANRISGVNQAGLPWLVAELSAESSGRSETTGRSGQAPELVGYAYATGWKSRPAYRYTTEVSVYVAPGREGLGVGSALYGHLLPEIASLGVHVALGGITLPNAGSVALHEKFGFHKVAHLEEVGFKFGRWIDVGYWQRTL